MATREKKCVGWSAVTELVIWALAAFGLSWSVADSKLTLPSREWMSRQGRIANWALVGMECVACTGGHIGWIGYLAGLAPFEHWYIAAFFTCASNLLLAKLVGMLDE